MGNICRSPAGENVMRHLLENQSLEQELELDSAGTIGFHSGKGPDPRMVSAARQRGIEMSGRARQVSPQDFECFDWILAMDQDNYDDLLVVREQCDRPTAQLVKFCTFCEDHDEDDVPDPYYGGESGFERVLDLMEDGCSNFLHQFK